MPWLAFIFALEFGFLPYANFSMYRSDYAEKYCPMKYTAYADLAAELIFLDYAFIGGGVRTSFWRRQGEGLFFLPHKAVYRFDLGARWYIFEIG